MDEKSPKGKKIEALGLTKWISEDFIFINKAPEHFKPSHFSFNRLMLHCHEQFPESDFIYYYIGDNPQKDFLAPNQLGWESVCLLDDGSNIHEQVFDMEKGYLPTGMIRQMNEILNNVKDGY